MKHTYVLLLSLWLVVGVLAVAPGGASAHSVTFDFTGTVVAATPNSLGGIFTTPILGYPASTIAGSFTFDMDVRDSDGNPAVGRYDDAIEALSFSITKPLTGDVYQFALVDGGALNSIVVNAGSPADVQSYVVSASVHGRRIYDGVRFHAKDFFINLLNPSTTVFTTDSLPETAPSLDPFSLYHATGNPAGQVRVVFGSSLGDHTIIGNLTSLTLAAVPVPAAAWLFGSGVFGLAGLARRGITVSFQKRGGS